MDELLRSPCRWQKKEEWQLLEDHLTAVGALAEEFASLFAPGWGTGLRDQRSKVIPTATRFPRSAYLEMGAN